MSLRWAFIVNPTAGGGRAKKIASELALLVSARNLNAKIVKTSSPSEGTLLAKALSEDGFNPIVAVGGDGTVNEVVNGIAKKGPILGVVPAGTGNDFIHITGFPESFTQKDWDVFFKAHTRRIDLGICNGRYFINGMGFGFDAHVASEVSRTEGKRRYMFSVLKNLLFYREPEITVFEKGTFKKRKCFLKTVGIGKRFGGGFLITARATADDGLFDICTAEEVSILRRLYLLLKVRKGNHINSKEVNYYRTDALRFHCREALPYHLDGEVLFSKTFDIKILPRAIEVIINPGEG
ncbi:MAG: diacylglycerol kinase family lipid kinase [Nitrospirae bacterium]|nr:MAG: diacylglycerol kinase family lipid kinase [Nitrospirota bacterium]